MRRILRRHHEHGDEFEVETSEGQIDNANEFFRVLQQVGGGIAGISLLVGGIGIMNILLVSVAERTREIGHPQGPRRQARATSSGQFLAESVVLSMVGGLLGILSGLGLGLGAAFVIQQLAPARRLPALSRLSPCCGRSAFPRRSASSSASIPPFALPARSGRSTASHVIFLESIRIALGQIWVNKLRTALTLLGMMIGVGAVVGIVSIGEGMRQFVIDEFGKLGGAQFVMITPEYRQLKDGRWVPTRATSP